MIPPGIGPAAQPESRRQHPAVQQPPATSSTSDRSSTAATCRSDPRVRADRARASATRRSTSSATTAAIRDEDLRRDRLPTRGSTASVRWHEYVTDDELARAVRAGARLRVSVGVRRARPDAARSAGGRRAAGAARHAGGARELRRRRAVRAARRHRRRRRARSSGCCSTRRRARGLLAAAPAVLARYSWPRAARETLAVLEACVKAPPWSARCGVTDLSIIIVSYNARADLERCLGVAARPRRRPSSHEIVVVDNASTRRQRRRGAALAGCTRHRDRREPSASPPPTTSASARAPATQPAAAQQRHRRARRRDRSAARPSSTRIRTWRSSVRGSSMARGAPSCRSAG